jgi:hypothetical protein
VIERGLLISQEVYQALEVSLKTEVVPRLGSQLGLVRCGGYFYRVLYDLVLKLERTLVHGVPEIERAQRPQHAATVASILARCTDAGFARTI